MSMVAGPLAGRYLAAGALRAASRLGIKRALYSGAGGLAAGFGLGRSWKRFRGSRAGVRRGS